MLIASPAAAQPADLTATVIPDADPAPVRPLGYGALPGGLHAPSADTLPKGMVVVGALSGVGRRTDLLGDGHKLTRGIGDLAIAFAPTSTFTLALSLDGRYDSHSGAAPAGDEGYVGDPRLIGRLSKAFGPVRLGGQVGVWVPGKDAPSVAASAISVDARALASIDAGPGTLSVNAGFRLDNSAKSVDDPIRLSLEDRISLGVSDFHAVVGGALFVVPVGNAFVGAEGSVDLFVGSGAPSPILRGGIHGGVHLSDQWSVLAFVELAKVPGIDAADIMANDIALLPYEPMITGGIGVHARFGGPRSVSHITRNENPTPIEVIEYADVTGQVTDESGKPVVGAKVTVKLKNNTGTGATDDKGTFTVTRLPIGKTVGGETMLDDTGAEVTVAVDGKKPVTSTLTLAKGSNEIAKLTLEPLLPPGQLRAVLRAGGTGKAIVGAIVTIEPGGATATSGPDGTISVDLAPGQYKATATAPGFREQTLDVTIDPNGVAVKNFELPK